MNEQILRELDQVIRQRKEQHEEGSYTGYLFEQGLDKILKKCGEECTEMIIAAKNDDPKELAMEIGDLVYHVLVLMQEKDLPLEAVAEVLRERSAKTGNRKAFHQVDKNS